MCTLLLNGEVAEGRFRRYLRRVVRVRELRRDEQPELVVEADHFVVEFNHHLITCDLRAHSNFSHLIFAVARALRL